MADLKAQLELSNQRETALIDEKSKLLDLLSAEKEEKRALMPPVEEKNRKSPKLAAPSCWRAIVPSNQKSNLPIFRLSDKLYKFMLLIKNVLVLSEVS